MQPHDDTDPDDWRVVRRQFTALFTEHLVSRDRFAHYGGALNFMTPDVLGYVRGLDGSRIEVSTGMFMDDRMFGATWPRRWRDDDWMPDDRDGSFDSLDALHAHVFSSAVTVKPSWNR